MLWGRSGAFLGRSWVRWVFLGALGVLWGRLGVLLGRFLFDFGWAYGARMVGVGGSGRQSLAAVDRAAVCGGLHRQVLVVANVVLALRPVLRHRG